MEDACNLFKYMFTAYIIFLESQTDAKCNFSLL